jgi:HEAT repeat protein
MRFSRSLHFVSILLLVLAGLPMAHAQLPEAEQQKRITSNLALLERGNEEEQASALFQLAQLSLPTAQGVPLFQAHLQRRTKTLAEAGIVAHAVEGLVKYGAAAKPALPDLIRLLDDVATVQGAATNGDQTWWWLTTALSKIGPDDPEAVAALKRALRRSLDSPDRLGTLTQETAIALSEMGRSAHTAVPLLTLALDRNPDQTWSLAVALSRMMPEAALSVPTLVRALEAGRAPEAVAEALGSMGSPAKSALPALHRALAQGEPKVAYNAFAAIAHIEGQPVLTVRESVTILKRINKSRLSAVYAAFFTVKREGTKAEAAVPTLAEIVAHSKDSWLRRTAVETLAEVGPARNRQAALALLQAAKGEDPVIALDAGKAFENFGTTAELVVPELSALLRIHQERLRESVEILLYPLGGKAAGAVPDLMQVLKEAANGKPNGSDIRGILWLFDRMGPEARVAARELTDLLLRPRNSLNNPEEAWRTPLLTTLMKIGITPRVLPVVREMLQSAQPLQVACAAHAVSLLGPQAIDTVPLLLRPLRQDYKDAWMTSGFFFGYIDATSARVEAMRALAGFGPAAKEALPLLRPYAELPDLEPKRPDVPLHGPARLKQEAQRAIQAIQLVKGAE